MTGNPTLDGRTSDFTANSFIFYYSDTHSPSKLSQIAGIVKQAMIKPNQLRQPIIKGKLKKEVRAAKEKKKGRKIKSIGDINPERVHYLKRYGY